MVCFFCYCALEQTAGLWASSYLSLYKGVSAETAATFASMFYIGITVGRALSGFVTMKLNDVQMIRLGQVLIAVGILIMFLPFGQTLSLVGLIVIGLGCAPIYPCIIHSTPTLLVQINHRQLSGYRWQVRMWEHCWCTCFWIDCKSYHGCVIAGVLVYYFDFDVCDA